jgi:hypothetical protein
MELVDSVFDIFPVYGNAFDQNIITDIEIIDDPEQEQLDRAMWALVKQQGQDPVELADGIMWSQYIAGEIPPALILAQIRQGILAEGPGVKITPSTTRTGTDFLVELVRAVP